MSRTIHFWFDYSCPYAYLGSTQVEALAARAGAALVWEPMLLGGVFKANDTPQNLMNVLSPAKAAHNARDMHRWAELFGVPLVVPSAHPMRTVEALRATLACGIDPEVIRGFYAAYWVDGRAPSDPNTMRDVLVRAAHDPDSVLPKLDAYRDELRARTDRAIALGIFGAPSFVVSAPGEPDRMFWGQDRLDFVERAASGRPLRR